jgi:hypothetical protein
MSGIITQSSSLAYMSDAPHPLTLQTRHSIKLVQAFDARKDYLKDYCEQNMYLPNSLDLLNKKFDELSQNNLPNSYQNQLLDILLTYTLQLLKEMVSEPHVIQIIQPDGSVVIGKKINPNLNSITKASDLTITILNAYKKTKTGSNFSLLEKRNAIKSVITAFKILSQSPLYDSETQTLIDTQLKKIENLFKPHPSIFRPF